MSGKLLKSFSWWSLIGISFSLTNSWLGLSSSLVIGLTNGGPVLIIYGLIVAMFFALMSSVAISDFATMLPNASGPCFWTLKLLSDPVKNEHVEVNETKVSMSKTNLEIQESELSFETEEVRGEIEEHQLEKYCDAKNVMSQRKWKKGLGIATGLINYAGAVFTTSSICSSLSLSILGVYSLMHPHYRLQHWHVFLTYEILNIFIALGACYGKLLPLVSKFGLVISVFSYIMTFLVSIISRSLNHNIPWPEAKTIFHDFENKTEWPPAMTFILGLINPCWAFAGLDSATHMVDDTGYNRSRKLVPRVLICNVLLGFLTSFTYAIAMFYCVIDSNAIVNSVLPIVQIYYQATGNKSLSTFMQCCCIITGTVCGLSSSTWQNRILWSVSRTYRHLYGSEMHKSKVKIVDRLSTISSPFDVPLYAHLLSHFFVLVVGCIFMGSNTAFNAIVSACISILYLSYAVPCTILVFHRGRKRLTDRVSQEQCSIGISPSKVRGGIFALFPHIATICWALFCFVMFAFPNTLSVTGGNMNYVCVVYAAVAVLVLIAVIT